MHLQLQSNNYNEDSSLNADWKEYSDSIDKSKVKALAFEYLDTDGNKAVLPANSQTYVLVKMKAPPEENRSCYKILFYGIWILHIFFYRIINYKVCYSIASSKI